jgi:hypothetical protein
VTWQHPKYPDRDRWPAYSLKTMAEPWRLPVVLVITFAAAALADRIVAWIGARWEGREGS